MQYVQFGSNISPDYVMPADTHRQCKNIYRCFGILDSEYMAIAVESVEMGGGGLKIPYGSREWGVNKLLPATVIFQSPVRPNVDMDPFNLE